MSDVEIFKEPGISITPTLVKINSSTYSVANIGSVYVTQQKIGGLIIGAIIFGIMALGGVAAIFSPDKSDPNGGGPFLLGITGGLAAIAGLCIYRAINRNYYLTFRTASADQKALTSTNKGYLFRLQKAIEEAITRRG